MINLQTLLILIILVAGTAGVIIFAFSRQMKKLKTDLSNEEKERILLDWFKDMKEDVKSSVDKTSEVLDRQLSDHRKTLTEQTKVISERLEFSSKVIQQVHRELGGITEFGKDMKDLSNVLKSPKLRGGLGEQFLYEILGNSLPKELYKTQYRFKSGETCDAVVKTDKGLISIDSKFPMEKFKEMLSQNDDKQRESLKKEFIRHVKKHIDDISAKYIIPEEGTTDFAVMYVPSENVYYELVVNTPEIEEYSREKRVVITSPNTINYMVRAILIAYQQSELQKHAGEILKALSGIKTEAEKFDEELGVLGGHITRTYKAMDNVKIKFSKLFGKIENTQALGASEEEQKKLPQT